jgi:hypothetical protein
MSPRNVVLWLSVSVLTACATYPRVKLDYDPGVNFRQLTTYAWTAAPAAVDSVAAFDALPQERVESVVDGELRAKGYRKVHDQPPDFWAAYHVTTRRKMDLTPYQATFGYGGWWHPYYSGGAYGNSYYAREYEESALELDMLDGKTRKLIWRATARGPVDEDATPQTRAAELRRTVQRMLQGFPPGTR